MLAQAGSSSHIRHFEIFSLRENENSIKKTTNDDVLLMAGCGAGGVVIMDCVHLTNISSFVKIK